MALEAGTRLGHYEVVSSLGAGGMGEVYRAKDTKLGREVAIKLLLEEVSRDPKRLARFEREAKVLASLNHPNIATLYGFEGEGDRSFLIMELVEGETLAERIKRGAIPVDEALPLFLQIAEGLEAAHEKGVTHRDLKPANIKITEAGQVKILDFGLAKAMVPKDDSPVDALASTELILSKPGQIMGTAAYMSPEQASGTEVDTRTDIWAIGCCLYEALAGGNPFQGTTFMNTIRRVCEREPDWSVLPAETPARLRELVERCLQKDPTHRPRNIAEVRLELTRSALASSGRDTEPGAIVFKAFLSTSLIDGTDLKRRQGDAAAAETLLRHDELFVRCLKEFGGSEHKIDDGLLAAFDVSSEAVRCALAFQRGIAELDTPRPLTVRIGIHAAEIIHLADSETLGPSGESYDTRVGLAVDTASRVMSLALGGQLLLTRGAFDSARQILLKAPDGSALQWLAHGVYYFKGPDESVGVFEVGIEGFSPLAPPPDSERGKRVLAPGEEDTLGWRPAAGLTIPRRENWILQEQMGEGGYGEVWLAEHKKTGAKRVFKFCFEPDRVRGLQREVVLFRLLRESLGERTDIAQVLDWQFDRPPYFLEVEYTSGGDFGHWAEEQGGLEAVELEQRLELVAQAATALGAAHSAGVLHKDIKPSNLLVETGPEGPRVRLADFGIGLVTSREVLIGKGVTVDGFTRTLISSSSSSGAGTPLYMAPEVLEGKPATTRSDVYALGVLLYQTVVADFRRALAPGWERQVEDELLREDIAMCVDGNPDRRLTSASELAQRLSTLETRRADRKEARRQKEAAQNASRRRRQFLVVSAVGIVLTILVGLVAFRENGLRTAAEEARSEAEYKQYVAAIQLAQVQLDRGDKPAAQRWLVETPEIHRGWEWGHLVNRAWSDLREEYAGEATTISDARRGQTASQIWDGASARVAKRYKDFDEPVSSAYFSHDGRKISAAGSDSGTGLLYDTVSNQRATLRVSVGAREHRVSRDDRYGLVSTALTGVFLFDYEKGVLIGRPFRRDTAVYAWFAPDSRKYVSSSADSVVRIYEIPSRRELVSLEGFRPPGVPDVAFDPEGEFLWTTWGRQQVKRWNLGEAFKRADSGETATDLAGEVFEGPAAAGFFSVRVSPDVRSAASYHPDGQVMIWDIATGQERFRVDVRQESPALGPAFSPDGSTVITVSPSDAVELWDAATGRLLLTAPGYVPSTYPPQLSPDGSRLLIPGTDGSVTLLGPAYETAPERGVLAGHTDWVWDTAFNSDGSRIMTLSYDGTARVWEVDTGALLLTLEGHGAPLAAGQWSDDDRLLLTTAWDNKVRVWDAATGELLDLRDGGLPFPNFGGGPRLGTMRSVTNVNRTRLLGPDGRRLLKASRGGGAEIIDLSDGSTIHTLPSVANGLFLFLPAFSPDGSMVTGEDIPTGIVRVWDAATGMEIFRPDPGWSPSRTYFSSTGRYLVLVGSAGQTKVYDLRDKSEKLSLQGHSGIMTAAGFNPDDSLLATASNDGMVKLWDVETGEEVAMLTGHTQGGVNVAFSPDGTRLLTTSKDNTAKIWDLQGNELLTIASAGELFSGNWSPDGTRLALTFDNRTHIYDSLTLALTPEDGQRPGGFEKRLVLAWGFPLPLPDGYYRIKDLAGATIAEGGGEMMQALLAFSVEIGAMWRGSLGEMLPAPLAFPVDVGAMEPLRSGAFRSAIAVHAALDPAQIVQTRPYGLRLRTLARWAFESGAASPISASLAVDSLRVAAFHWAPQTRTSDYFHHLDTLAANLWEIGLEEEAHRCQASAVAASYLFADEGVTELVANRLEAFGGALPEPPHEDLLFTSLFGTRGHPLDENSATVSERQENLAKIDAALNEYLDRAAPLPDLDAIQSTLREMMPPSLPPDSPMRELVGDLLRLVEETLGSG